MEAKATLVGAVIGGLFLIGFAVLPALLALLLAKFRRDWPKHWIILVSVTPLPLVLVGFALYLFLATWESSAPECGGVDACASNALAAAVFSIIAAMATGLGYIGARLALKRRNQKHP